MKINKHELPDSVNVLGQEYKIFYDDNDNPKITDCSGYQEPWSKEIHIRKEFFIQKKDENFTANNLHIKGILTLRHEIIHAFLLESGLDDNCDFACNEELVDWIALQFPKIADCFNKLGIK